MNPTEEILHAMGEVMANANNPIDPSAKVTFRIHQRGVKREAYLVMVESSDRPAYSYHAGNQMCKILGCQRSLLRYAGDKLAEVWMSDLPANFEESFKAWEELKS